MRKGKKLIRIFLILIGQQSKSCNSFVQQQDDSRGLLIFQVTEGNDCVLGDDFTWDTEFEEVQINAIITIQRTRQLHLNYKKLEFGEKGGLTVFQYFQDPQIIFEQTDKSTCQLTDKVVGFLDIKSIPYIHEQLYTPAKKGDDRISLRDSDLLSFVKNQEIILIDPREKSHKETAFADSVIGTDLKFSYILQNEYNLDYDHKIYGNPFYYSSSRDSNSVTFINSCLSVKVKHLVGVNFLNVRGLRLEEGKIENCLFQEELDDEIVKTNSWDKNKTGIVGSAKRVPLKIYSFIQFSIFEQLSNYDITFDGESFGEESLFHEVTNTRLIFKSTNKVHNIKFISCYLALELWQSDPLILSGVTFTNTQVSLITPNSCELSFKSNSLFSAESKISFASTLCSVSFEGVSFLDTQFDLSSIFIRESLSFEDCLIYKSRPDDYFVKLQTVENMSAPFKLNLTQVRLLGAVENLFIQHSSKSTFFSNRISPNYSIILREVIFNTNSIIKDNLVNRVVNSQEIDRIFKLDNKQIKHQSKIGQSESCLMKIEEYNKPFQNVFPVIGIKDSKYVSTDSFSEITIRNALFNQQPRQYYHQTITLIGQPAFKVDSSQILQILPEKMYNIGFENKGTAKVLNIGRMDLTIGVVKAANTALKNYKIVFKFTNQAVERIQIQKYLDPQNQVNVQRGREEIYTSSQLVQNGGIGFIKDPKQNQLEIVWTNKETLHAAYRIELSFCEEGEFLENNSCARQCSGVSQDYICTTSCSDGFYLNAYNYLTKTCSSCSAECAACTTESNCQSCKEGYFLNNNRCTDTCSTGQYYNGNRCVQCSPQCVTCNNEQECTSYKKGVDCEEGTFSSQESICEQCNPLCKTCSGSSGFECTTCKHGYEMRYSVCMKQLQNS